MVKASRAKWYIKIVKCKRGCVMYGWFNVRGAVLYMVGSIEERLGYIWMVQWKSDCVMC